MNARGRALGWGVSAVVLATAWSVLALWVAPAVTPTIPEVLRRMWLDRSFYVPHVVSTLGSAAWGWLVGNALAVLVGAGIVLSRTLAPLLERLSVAIYAVPLLAVGPILQIVAAGTTTKITLAAMAVFFTTTVTWVLGLRSSDAAAIDVVRTAGGGRFAQFLKVRAHAALPFLFAGLQIAAPAAVLGAIIGEYLGGQRGLGVAMIQSQSSFVVDRTWGLAIVIALLVGLLYAVTGLVGRTLLPWAYAGSEVPIPIMQLSDGAHGGRWSRLGWGIGSAVVLVTLWWGLLEFFDLHPYFANRPVDVWRFVTQTGSEADLAALQEASLVTLMHTGVGFAVGLLLAIMVTMGVVLSPVLDRIVTPVAVTLRSVPIIAMTPLLVLLFGRGLGVVTVIVGLVTFFPTLVAATTAMRNASAQACELVEVYGGSELRQLWIVRVPSAVPALFAAARIAFPAAIGGALLAEWLATGRGLGSLMLRASASSRFGIVWTASVLIVAASVLGYTIIGGVETRIARRIGQA